MLAKWISGSFDKQHQSQNLIQYDCNAVIVGVFCTYELWITEKAFLRYARKFWSMIADANGAHKFLKFETGKKP